MVAAAPVYDLRMPYTAAEDRYDRMRYRRCGRSGLQLPAITLGLWHNFGGDRPLEGSRAILRRAFDLGRHPLRPRQQLRAAVRLGGGDVRARHAGRPAALSRRARDLDQSGLRHVARPVRRMGLAEVPARFARPVARADGARVRRHLLLAPVRPGDAARGDARRPRHGRPAGQGALRRNLVVLRRRRRARRRGSSASSARRS